MEANNFNAVYGSCFRAGNFSGSPLWHRRLQAATSRWPIAFDPEGLPLDQGVSLNCGIRFSRAIPFAIVNLTPNGICWQHIFPLVLRLSKTNSRLQHGLFGRTTLALGRRIRLRFSVWSARNAFAVAQSDLTFPGEINRLAEDPRGLLRRMKAG